VTFGDKGNLVPYQEPDVIYLNREELQDYIEAHKDALEVVNYDDMVYQAGKLKSEYTSQQHEIIESGLHSFEFEDGYLYFSLDVNGNSFDGLYRIYDPVNGKSREIVSFNDYDPVIKENWDFIERRLTQYVNEHPEVGLNGEQIPRERPSIYCEWSEHGAFREGTVYSPSEFSQIMEESDNEWIKLREMELQQYGKDAFDILMDQGLPQHQTYAKVKYEIYIPGMEPLTVRQDIGDGFGSVYSFLKRNGYMEYANNLIKNMSDVQIQERLNYIHTNYVNMLGDIQKFARFEIDDLHGEQDCRELYKKTEKVAIESSIKESTNNNNQSNIPSAEKIDAAINDVMEQINIQIAEPNFALEL
ncbi:MAG: LPD25 domain-containing protein, partial [Lachnospiraceae bacterium]